MHRAERLLQHLTASSLQSSSSASTSSTSSSSLMSSDCASNGAAAAAAEQLTIDNWINGAPCKPTHGKYMSLWQPRDGTQTGQVALSTKQWLLRCMRWRLSLCQLGSVPSSAAAEEEGHK